MRKIGLFKSYISLRSILNVCFLLLKSNYGTYIGEGPQVKKFEEEFGEKFGLKNILALNSGTSALELAYELAGIEQGDEVITPVLTFVGTNLPLVHRKANIIFADCEDDLNIDIEDVKKKITPKTKAIVFVHFGGNNRGLKEILEIGRDKNILIIEDAAQAVGSDFWGKSDFACISLQAIKTLTSGDGGMLVCKNIENYKKAKRLRWFGYDRDEKQKKGDVDLLEAGYKYHMNDITASIGRGNLRSIDKIISHRKSLMLEYGKYGIKSSIWFAYIISSKHDEISESLKEKGVSTGIHHWRNDKYTVFGGVKQKLVNMDRIEGQYLLLPLHHGLSTKDIKKICRIIFSIV